jgi:hypothetical protein
MTAIKLARFAWFESLLLAGSIAAVALAMGQMVAR